VTGEPSRAAALLAGAIGYALGAAALLAGAIGYALGACVQVAPEEMTLPTSCADWDLHAPLAHLAASMLGPCLPVYTVLSDGQAAIHHLAPGHVVLTISLSLLCLTREDGMICGVAAVKPSRLSVRTGTIAPPGGLNYNQGHRKRFRAFRHAGFRLARRIHPRAPA
jgi:hypothetical protein